VREGRPTTPEQLADWLWDFDERPRAEVDPERLKAAERGRDRGDGRPDGAAGGGRLKMIEFCFCMSNIMLMSAAL